MICSRFAASLMKLSGAVGNFGSKCLVFWLLTAGTAISENGIDFADMPVGCTWVYEYSSGARISVTFLGWREDSYLLKSRDELNSGEFLELHKYNKDGFMTWKLFPDNRWEKFSPHNCFPNVGNCRFTHTSSDGPTTEVSTVTRKVGDKLGLTARNAGQAPFGEDLIELGPYDLIISQSSPSYSARITEFRNCGVPIS
jgi:hypothetical protein